MSCCCCACVDEKTYGIVQNCGKFSRVMSPGFACLKWPCESVAGVVSLKLQQLPLQMEAKTKENVFVTLKIAIQYLVESEHVQLSFYSMTNPNAQMQSFVEDAIRSIVPALELEQLFMEKDKIGTEIREDLAKKMTSYGYSIVDTLIIDIEPEHTVKAAMNKINESKRLRQAAEYQAETEKLVRVKQAEAEAESKRLQGEGVAAQRKAILHGLQEGVENLSKAINISPDETMQYTMLTQYFDMLKDVGTSKNKTIIFIPHSPSTVGDISSQLRGSMMEGIAALEMNKK